MWGKNPTLPVGVEIWNLCDGQYDNSKIITSVHILLPSNSTLLGIYMCKMTYVQDYSLRQFFFQCNKRLETNSWPLIGRSVTKIMVCHSINTIQPLKKVRQLYIRWQEKFSKIYYQRKKQNIENINSTIRGKKVKNIYVLNIYTYLLVSHIRVYTYARTTALAILELGGCERETFQHVLCCTSWILIHMNLFKQ